MNKRTQICSAILVRISILTHCHLTPDETAAARRDMSDMLTAADAARIPWKLQNSLLYIGEKYDIRAHYVVDLLRIAFERVNAQLEV